MRKLLIILLMFIAVLTYVRTQQTAAAVELETPATETEPAASETAGPLAQDHLTIH